MVPSTHIHTHAGRCPISVIYLHWNSSHLFFVEMEEVDAEEAFEKMMRQEREKQKQMTSEVTGDALSSQTGQSPEMKSQNRESILIGDMLSTPDKTNTLTPSTPETQRDNKQVCFIMND